MSERPGKLRQCLFAWALAHLNRKYERAVAERKRRLFTGLSGVVVEIGPGTGANLPYYLRGIHWINIEPNPYMDKYLAQGLKERGIDADLRRGVAEQIPLPDSSANAVVSTLVLCSLADLARSLAEIRRVLRPGGRFLFIEHVAAPRGTWLRRIQEWVKPAWKALGDGCHPDRETGSELERAGFAKVEYASFRAPVPVASPQIAGVAIK